MFSRNRVMFSLCLSHLLDMPPSSDTNESLSPAPPSSPVPWDNENDRQNFSDAPEIRSSDCSDIAAAEALYSPRNDMTHIELEAGERHGDCTPVFHHAKENHIEEVFDLRSNLDERSKCTGSPEASQVLCRRSETGFFTRESPGKPFSKVHAGLSSPRRSACTSFKDYGQSEFSPCSDTTRTIAQSILRLAHKRNLLDHTQYKPFPLTEEKKNADCVHMHTLVLRAIESVLQSLHSPSAMYDDSGPDLDVKNPQSRKFVRTSKKRRSRRSNPSPSMLSQQNRESGVNSPAAPPLTIKELLLLDSAKSRSSSLRLDTEAAKHGAHATPMPTPPNASMSADQPVPPLALDTVFDDNDANTSSEWNCNATVSRSMKGTSHRANSGSSAQQRDDSRKV